MLLVLEKNIFNYFSFFLCFVCVLGVSLTHVYLRGGQQSTILSIFLYHPPPPLLILLINFEREGERRHIDTLAYMWRSEDSTVESQSGTPTGVHVTLVAETVSQLLFRSYFPIAILCGFLFL